VKYPLLSVVVVFLVMVSSLFQVSNPKADVSSDAARLNDADAFQAMAIANKWKWSRNEIKSHVTPREVVFEFPDGKAKRVALPENSMVVAVAPYITRTHE
jgi:hypothetical protein